MKKTICYKECFSKDGTQHWVLSHITFLRSGDTFKIPGNGTLMAVSDPYFNKALKEMDIKMIRKT